MADDPTRIADVIDPEVLATMVLAELPNNTFLIPGVFTSSEFPIGTFGTVWEIPYNENLGDLETYDPTVDLSVQDQGQDVYRMIVIRKAAIYGADKIVKLAAYKDPMDYVTQQLATQVIPDMYMSTQITVLEGAIPTDNRYDGSAGVMRASQVRNAKQLLHDKGYRLKSILMHSKQFGDLEDNDEIVYQPKNTIYPLYGSQGNAIGLPPTPADMVPTVAGLVIFVSDNCTLGGTSPETYVAYLLSPNCMGHFWQQGLNIDLERYVKGKQDWISPDLDFVMCLHGVDYTSTSWTDANLGSTANYTLKWDHKLVGAVRLLTL